MSRDIIPPAATDAFVHLAPAPLQTRSCLFVASRNNIETSDSDSLRFLLVIVTPSGA